MKLNEIKKVIPTLSGGKKGEPPGVGTGLRRKAIQRVKGAEKEIEKVKDVLEGSQSVAKIIELSRAKGDKKAPAALAGVNSAIDALDDALVAFKRIIKEFQ